MHLVTKETHAVEVVTKRFAFRATGEAFHFLERNPWFVRYLVLVYALWLFRKPLRLWMGWMIVHLPERHATKHSPDRYAKPSRRTRTRTATRPKPGR